nr:YitT family protein [Clostridia bacterium]
MKKVKNTVIDVLFWTAGAFIYALGFNFFLEPNKIVIGGVTGLAGLINYVWPVIPAGAAMFVLNVPLFIAAWKFFGVRFIVNTVVAVALNSAMIDVQPLFMPVFKGNVLLAAVFGGMCAGVGQGLTLRRNATTGGTDIGGRLLRLRFPYVSLGSLELIMNSAIIILAGFVYGSVESMLLSIIVVFVTGKAIDFVVYGSNSSKMLLVVTTHGDEICREIT